MCSAPVIWFARWSSAYDNAQLVPAIDSDLYFFEEFQSNASYVLREAYRKTPSTEIIYQDVASWTKQQGLSEITNLEKYERRKNLSGVFINATTYQVYVGLKSNLIKKQTTKVKI